jgi:Patatin-like phospholipase
MTRAFTVKLGRRACAQIAREGLQPRDITCIPAAAGGPKGLALMPLDQWLFGEWFAKAGSSTDASHTPTLIGASIGAWRMAAAAQADPVAALKELARTYIEDQVYAPNPTPTDVAQLIRMLANSTYRAGGGVWSPRAAAPLRVVTARAAGTLLGDASRTGFAKAALANLLGRPRLGQHLRRVVFASGPESPLDRVLQGDAFGAEPLPLTPANAEDALRASGSIPLICDPVKIASDASGMPPGWYWDGGLIDYHLFYPYSQLDGLVLYPHLIDAMVPGWLDKFLPWRKQGVNGRGSDWLSNVILISPSREFLATLPNGKLPDRNDFYRYGADHPRRIADWKRAVAECQRFAEQTAAWLMKPDLTIAVPL